MTQWFVCRLALWVLSFVTYSPHRIFVQFFFSPKHSTWILLCPSQCILIPSLLCSRLSGCHATLLSGERCVTSRKTAAKETTWFQAPFHSFSNSIYCMAMENSIIVWHWYLSRGPFLERPDTCAGDIILFVSSKHRCSVSRNFAVILIFTPFTAYKKTSCKEWVSRSFMNGFSGPWSFQVFWETHACGEFVKKHVLGI